MDRSADAVGRPPHLTAAADRVETAPLDATQLWERYGAQVYKFAAIVSRGDVEAEDLAQEALYRAIRALPRFQPRAGRTEAWLWRIVVNTARDLGRVAKRRTMLLERLGLVGGREPAVADDVDARLTSSELLEAVRALNARQRTMIALRFASDLDYPTIGRILGLTSTGARAGTRRALANLRERLGASTARSEDA
jgi:RNA polymerase sigma factor (sigma-70 family)